MGHQGFSRPGANLDPARNLAGKLARVFRVLIHHDAIGQLVDAGVAYTGRGEDIVAETPIDQDRSKNVRQAVIGALTRGRMPFLRFAADLAPGEPVAVHRHRLDVIDRHVPAQFDRRRDWRLRVEFGQEIFEIAARQPVWPPVAAELAQFELAAYLAHAI